jgi:hypothetical protein
MAKFPEMVKGDCDNVLLLFRWSQEDPASPVADFHKASPEGMSGVVSAAPGRFETEGGTKTISSA